MPAPRRVAREDQARTSLQCSRQQKAILVDAAKRAGCDLNTLILTHALAGVGRQTGAAPTDDSPVIINGRVGAALRARAQEQGVTLDRVLEMLLLAGGSGLNPGGG